MPDAVRAGLSAALAMPKSASTTRPSGPSKMLAGFTSRCTTPASCTARRAPSTLRPIWAASAGETGPSSATVSRSERNGTSSMTMQGRSSSSTMS